ncbi:MAG: DUF362 domain-containing protein [Acidobacteria bacterium]|nr:DUF362 domain-containing protein [Acidobacteriota bacterium]
MSHIPDRRRFLKQAVALGAAAAHPSITGRFAKAQEAPKSRLVIVRDPAVLTPAGDADVDTAVLARMLDQGVARLTGHSDARAAWRSLFTPEDVVGVKINCLFGRGASTHPAVAHAVAAALVASGVKPSNVIIWDRSTGDLLKSGYTISKEGDGVRVLANDGVWEDEPTVQGQISGRLTRILTRDITALVNVPFMKDHGMAGVTGAMKNHYGSFDNPGRCHANHCDPYLADLNEIPVIRRKTRLIVMDALRPQADGGPPLRRDALWDYAGLLIARDPVAVDAMEWRIIEERRKATGLPTLAAAGREPTWIATAASRGLGVDDPSRMDIVRIG